MSDTRERAQEAIAHCESVADWRTANTVRALLTELDKAQERANYYRGIVDEAFDRERWRAEHS